MRGEEATIHMFDLLNRSGSAGLQVSLYYSNDIYFVNKMASRWAGLMVRCIKLLLSTRADEMVAEATSHYGSDSVSGSIV